MVITNSVLCGMIQTNTFFIKKINNFFYSFQKKSVQRRFQEAFVHLHTFWTNGHKKNY